MAQQEQEILREGIIKFIVKKDGVQIQIECGDFRYFELLGLLEETKFTLINDNKQNK